MVGGIVDTQRYPLGDLGDARRRALVARCRASFEAQGSFTLEGFLRAEALAEAAGQVEALMGRVAHRHVARHNVYFSDEVPGLPADHGALAPLESANYTLTCDQLAGTHVREVYEWDGLLDFLVEVLDGPRLYRMQDPLARLNVMGYGEGDALDWHFDRSQFTVTVLLQEPQAGGTFEYRRHLRTDTEPRYDAVARLLAGEDPDVRALPLPAGTLNVFAGRYAAHRVTPVEGPRMRMVAILSYVESPGMSFSDGDRVRFYGRAR